MSRFSNLINEMGRAAATVALSVSVGAGFFALAGGTVDPSAKQTRIETELTQVELPDRPAGGRRWRSSNAEQSQSLLSYYGEDNPWNRHHAQLEGAMSLFQIGDTFSSKEIAQGALRVTLTEDYLGAYLAMPFLGGEAPVAFALNEPSETSEIKIGPVLARAFGAELLARP